jgi:vacuolar-type H+-ATPase subunit F/Vma7
MISSIPPEITITSFSIIGVLTGYIWNYQSKSISEIKKKQDERPCNVICVKIEKIQNDIQWIKETFKNRGY